MLTRKSALVLAFLAMLTIVHNTLAGDMNSMLWGPSVVVGFGATTEITLVNHDDESKQIVLGFNRPFDADYRFPMLSVNGSAINDSYEFTIAPRAIERYVVKSGLVGMGFNGWLCIMASYKDPVLRGVSGYITRLVDGKEYTSPLTTWGNKFQFPVEETSSISTAIVITKDAGAFYSLSDITLTLVGLKGEAVALRSYKGVHDLTQDAKFLWQHFAVSVAEWRELVGENFRGSVKVTVQGWPVAATSVIVFSANSK